MAASRANEMSRFNTIDLPQNRILVGATPFHEWFSSATFISHHPSLMISTPRHMPLHIPLEHFAANPPSIANLYCSRQSPRFNPAINRSAPHIQ